jgi:hypothetical protein
MEIQALYIIPFKGTALPNSDPIANVRVSTQLPPNGKS